MSPPRLHVLPAVDAAVVLRRGPSRWWHVLRWHLDPPSVEPGAWLRAQLYPRRCAVSADGELLGYFALAARPAPWDSYLAVSKAPWLHALAAWHVGSTWHWGCEFLPDGRFCTGEAEPSAPDSGSYPAGLARRPLLPELAHPDRWRLRDVQQELRRGWVEHATTGGGAIAAGALVLRRPRPGDERTALLLVHAGHGGGRPGIERADVTYMLERDGEPTPLPDIAWADWDAAGRVLAATLTGRLRIDALAADSLENLWSHDLADLRPAPTQAPDWARAW